MLGEMEQVTGLHRKSLVRLMRGKVERRPRQRQRGKYYGHEVRGVTGVVAESLGQICVERVHPNLLKTDRDWRGIRSTVEVLKILQKYSVIESCGRV